MKKNWIPLRDKIEKKLITQTETPLIIYLAVALAIFIAWSIRRFNEDLSQNLISELIGAAFIIFVVNLLLVRSKNKRWKVVNEKINYLIARNVNRLRDGTATRAFEFNPILSELSSGNQTSDEIRFQREALFASLLELKAREFSTNISNSLFTEENYQYFNEKAEDLWDILNMKYSEYLEPGLITMLMDLYIQLKDLCAHIRVYRKGQLFPEDSKFYRKYGMNGAAHNLIKILELVSQLKAEGYSETARVDSTSLE